MEETPIQNNESDETQDDIVLVKVPQANLTNDGKPVSLENYGSCNPKYFKIYMAVFVIVLIFTVVILFHINIFDRYLYKCF
jgi:hypothetical protein